MFDTVNFRIDKAEVSASSQFDCVKYLSEVTEHQNEKKGYYCTGKMGDYNVRIDNWNIFLIGSLAKYYFDGNNIYTLTRQSTQEAMEKLSDNLHLDIKKAIPFRIDVATIFPTEQQPSDYYSYLGNKTHFKRLHTHKETLYYNNHKKQLVLYDKSKEAISKGMDNPIHDDNLLRYELRFLNRINKQFQTEVRGSTLYQEIFYSAIIKQWYNEFKTIQKLKSKNFMLDNVNSKKTAKEAFISYAMQQLDVNTINEFLNELKAGNKLWNKADYSKLKNELNNLIVSKKGNQKTDLINELDKKILQFSMYAR